MPQTSSASATRRSISARAIPRFSIPKAASRSTLGYTACSSGSWKTNPTSRASSRVGVRTMS